MRSFLAGSKARLRGLRYGFLVVPGGIAVAFTALAFLFVAIDRGSGRDGLGFGIADDPEAARAVLTVIAGSLITVAGVTFSVTMITLQLVSQQFTPRALRGFLGDRVNQTVAGVYLGIFVYCLIVLRTVASSDSPEQAFVPALSVTAAIVAAVVALGLLLVFIDHMARRIQVSTIAGGIARDTLSTIDALYPDPFAEPAGDDPDDLLAGWYAEGSPEPVRPHRPGYVQAIELDSVPEDVGSPGLRIELKAAPGDFVTERDLLAVYWPGQDDADVPRALRLAITIANERDMKQDPGYGVRQLADIATKAISPGVNDPTTAWTCIRYLQAVMERLAARSAPDRVRRYLPADVTVVASRAEFGEYVEASYGQIGRYATDARVAGVLLDSICSVADAAMESGAAHRLAELRSAAERIGHTALSQDLPEADRGDLRRRLDAVLAATRPRERTGGSLVGTPG